MSIDLGNITKITNLKERTWRIEISSELGEDPTLVARREVVQTDEDGNVISRQRNSPSVIRRLGGIAATEFSVGGVKITGASLALVVAGVVDTLRREDMEKK